MLSDTLFVPQFVIQDLNEWSSSGIEEEKNRGRRGLATLQELREIEHLETRIHESELDRRSSAEDKILFVVSSLKGRLLTASESLVRRAEQQGVAYIDMIGLAKTLSYEVAVGETIAVRIVKIGKEDGQGVGYTEDGSMVVVNGAADLIGSSVFLEVESVIPTSGGRMVFGKLLGENV